jgi:hypothetical protein
MEEMQLKNGIRLTIEDKTVPLTGDLSMVRLEVSYSLKLDESETELREYCGQAIVKTRLIERPAVHASKLDEVKRSLRDSYLESTLHYMQRPSFATKLKRKTLAEYHEKLEQEARMRAAGREPD